VSNEETYAEDMMPIPEEEEPSDICKCEHNSNMSSEKKPAIRAVNLELPTGSIGVDQASGGVMTVCMTKDADHEKYLAYFSDCALHIIKETTNAAKDKTEFVFHGQGARDKRFVTFTMSAFDVADAKKWKSTLINNFGAVNKVGKLGFEMVQDMSLNVERVLRIEEPCWVGNDILLPGADFAGSLGERQIEYKLSPVIPAEIYEGNLPSAAECLSDLLNAHKYAPIVIATILGAPAIARWHPHDRFGLGMWGGTGAWKTTMTLLGLGVYGFEYTKEATLKSNSDGSTSVGAMETFIAAGCLPQLYDNLKTVKEKDTENYVGLIHAVLEGSEKARGKKEGGLRDQKKFLCIPIITGEVKPQESSTSARVLNLNWTPADANLLTKVREKADLLPIIGYHWLWFLASQDSDFCPDFETKRNEKNREFQEYVNPGRLATIWTLLESIWSLLERSPSPMKEVFINAHDNFYAALKEAALLQAQSVTQETELSRFLHGLEELMISSPAMFQSDIIEEQPVIPKPTTYKFQPRTIIGKRTKDGVQVLPNAALDELKKHGTFTQIPTEESLTRALSDKDYLIYDPDKKHNKYQIRINGKKTRGWYIKNEAFPSFDKTVSKEDDETVPKED